MASETEYQARVRGLDWGGLLRLWERVQRRETPGWGEGKAFEYLVLRAFELDGARVRWPFRVWLEGEEIEQIDGVVHTETVTCLVETKDTVKPVGTTSMAKLRNQLLRRPAGVVGVLFTRGDFTRPATTLAHFTAPQSILLWPGREVEYGLRQRAFVRGLELKYGDCVERGLSDYDIRKVVL